MCRFVRMVLIAGTCASAVVIKYLFMYTCSIPCIFCRYAVA